MKKSHCMPLLLGLAAFSAAACGSADESTGDSSTSDTSPGATITNVQDLHELTVLVIENDRTFHFYEPEEGHILVIETGRIGAQPPGDGTANLDAVQIYEKLSGRIAPEALSLAQQRKKAKALIPPTAEQLEARARIKAERTITDNAENAACPAEANGSNLAQSQQALVDDTAWWADKCRPQQESSHRWKYWRNQIGNATWELDDVWLFFSATFALSGDIHVNYKYRTWFTWSSGSSVDLKQGFYVNFNHDSGSDIDFDNKLAISDAANDVYDICGSGHK